VTLGGAITLRVVTVFGSSWKNQPLQKMLLIKKLILSAMGYLKNRIALMRNSLPKYDG